MTKNVVILGDFEDEHATYMFEHLQRRNVKTWFIDSEMFPRDLTIWLDPKSGDGAFGFADGSTLLFNEIESVYWRNYNGVEGPELPDVEQSYIAENDSRSLFESVLLTLETRWVNSFKAFRFHQTKGAQLNTVAKLGFPIPNTVLTNDPEAVRDFANYNRDAIFKPTQGGAHTRRLTPQMLQPETLRRLALAPITLQERVPGTNIRVFLVGRHCLACELRTGEVDFRDDEDAAVTPHKLPPAIEEEACKIGEALHLLWAGIDYRLTDDGEYVFLEANPSPMFLGFEERCSLPLSERLGDLLVNGIDAG